MASVLDQLIADQNRRSLMPASPAQLGTGQAGVLAPAAVVPPAVTVAPNSGVRTAADSFFFQPTMWEQNLNPAQVRQDLRLDDLKTIAAARRFELERAQKRAPLEDRLLEAQINASGSHDRFTREQDAQTLQHMSGFLTDLSRPDAPGPNDPNYRGYVFNSLLRNPRFAETPGGIDLLKKLADTNDTHVSISEIKKSLPEGFDVASVKIGSKGTPSYTLKQMGGDAELEKAAKGYGLTLDQVRNPIGAEVGKYIPNEGGGTKFVGDEAGDVVRVKDKEGKTVVLSAKEYERLGGIYSPETMAKRGGALDLTALARKALNDPNATEAEKAAARKRLGQ